MEEFHRIPIVIVEDEDELEGIVNEGKSKLELQEEDENKKSRIDPKDLVNRMKEKGGQCYKEKKIDEALGFYLKALGVLEFERTLKENVQDFELLMGEIVLRSNCIACYVEKKDFEKSISESRKLLKYINEEREGYLRKNGELPTLWVNIENKTRYRLSLSLYNLFGCEGVSSDENSKSYISESFEIIQTVLDYYQHWLKVSPPHEISVLYSKVKRAVESQNYEKKEVNSSLENLDSIDKVQSQTEKQDEEEVSTKQNNSNYLTSYITCFLEDYFIESGSYQKSIKSPIQIVDKMNCNNSIEFLRIWQNIYQNDQFIDYYLFFSDIFTNLDKIYNKTEMEVNILEKILERISVILDEFLKNAFQSKPKEKLVSHIFKIIRSLDNTKRFDFVALMLNESFQILNKMIQFKDSLSNDLLQELKHFQENQTSKGIQI
ncbi:putative Monad-binding region of RPAP3 family protein [Cryptosporidium meleagridis]|uniref:Putative Monad-binding region of RPAP3 family protein n=1 Tax=Cryptosporidium meleagridis TaxID=93969 RepID=A0A2P4Z3N5_9CRYT|nr:putative Monad-binding region of RPAP3 family protein [Cryptosporidium meleagridis]